MKKLTNILCIVLSVLMVATVFAGCNTENPVDSPSVITSVAPPKIELTKDAEFEIADGSSLVAVITDNQTGITCVKVAEGTTLKVFLENVIPASGYLIKITDADKNELTDQSALLEDGFVFSVYKEGDNTPAISYLITVTSQQAIESEIKEAESEASRVQSETALQQEQLYSSITTVPTISSEIIDAETNPNTYVTSVTICPPINTDIPDCISPPEKSNITISIASYNDILSNDKIYSKLRKSFEKKTESYRHHTVTFTQDTDLLDHLTISNRIMSGEKLYDLIETDGQTARELAKAGALVSLSEYKDLLNTSYTSRAVIDYMTIDGKIYGFSSNASCANSLGIAFNKELVELYVPDIDIYQLYLTRKWTDDVYAELLKKCTKDLNNSPNSYELFAVASDNTLVNMALASFSGGLVIKDKDGVFSTTINTEAGLAALNWCKNAAVNQYWKHFPDQQQAILSFANENCVTFAGYMNNLLDIENSVDFEIGFVPFPISHNSKDYVTQILNPKHVWCIPVTSKDSAYDAVIYLECLRDVNDEYIDVACNQYSQFLDDIAVDVYRWSVTNTTADYSANVFSSQVLSCIYNSCLDPSKTPADEMAAIKETAQKECNDWYNPQIY